MDVLLQSMSSMFTPMVIVLMILGVFIGLIFGTVPGLTSTMGMALFVPFTFTLEPVQGISFLICLHLGGVSGGLVASTLLGIPGTPSSIATTFDAYPMAKNGQPVRALGIGVIASLVGGILSFIALATISPIISRFAVQMGPFEFFALIFFALSLLAVLAQGSMLKGITAGFIGLAIGMVGFAPVDGLERYTFGVLELKGGIALLPLIMGLFAIAQILSEIRAGDKRQEMNFKVKGIGIKMAEFFANKWNLVRSSVIGIAFGILPGLGSGTSNLVAYAQTKQAAKDKEKFGKGAPEGIYASESANTAALVGSLIPMLTLGIPGDTVTAILLGGFMIHGIQPGPLFFAENRDIVNVVFIAFFVAIFLVLLFQLFAMRFFTRVLMVPKEYLFPAILVLCFIGAFATNSSSFDIGVMLFFGVIGYILLRSGFPIAPLILGFILGPLLETYLRRALMSTGEVTDFFTRPFSAIFILLGIACAVYTLVNEIRSKRSKQAPSVGM
ncbi:LOW QUALITY PROTEIN: tricarboxylate transport membrane protein TctA [Geomicrobium sp. JCM 19039]|nr:LOW QUALITY PROTEIN: tricarboxylate transport membrane protein TctA [Geomicrobium sp. JCM 19039]